MAIFRHSCVNLRDCLCDILHLYASAQSLGFLDLTKNFSFPNWKLNGGLFVFSGLKEKVSQSAGRKKIQKHEGFSRRNSQNQGEI